jgi:hypothetical protein
LTKKFEKNLGEMSSSTTISLIFVNFLGNSFPNFQISHNLKILKTLPTAASKHITTELNS